MDFVRIRLSKETFKFSSTHFTLFSESTAERLHGHNYQVSVECELKNVDSMGMGFEFNELKPLIKSLSSKWDERVLLPKLSPLLKIREELVRKTPHYVVDFSSPTGDRSYRFPKDEVLLLETVNVTSEELARLFAQLLARKWKSKGGALADRIKSLSVTIEETRGQSAAYIMDAPLTRTEFPDEP